MPTPIPQSDLVSSGGCIILYNSLAQKLGLNEAIVVQKIHFLAGVRGGREMNGEHWVFNTYPQWQRDHFPFWSISTIQRVFTDLETMGIVISCQPDGRMSRKKYYRLNTGVWVKLLKGSLEIPAESRSPQNGMIEDTNLVRSLTETTVQRGLKQSKESPPAESGDFNSEWKPDGRSREQKLASLKPPKDYPSQVEFDAFIDGETEGIGNYRPDLYVELCTSKWRKWYPRSATWRPIRDWKAYVLGLDRTIGDAASSNSRRPFRAR